MIKRREILGVRVDDAVSGDLMAVITTFRGSDEPHQIMTPNPEFVMIAQRNAAFRSLLDRVDLAPADGIGLRWAGALLGQPIREVIPGSDMTFKLAEKGAERGERWFLLGAQEGIAATAAQELMRRYPGLVVAGTHSGTPHPGGDEIACALIRAAGQIDVLLVAYGAPHQDFWIDRNQARLRIPIAMGVGGTFDLIAGRNPMPPRLIKRLHLIWLFRLVTQPWRWRRQLSLVWFVGLVARAALRQCIGRHTAGTRSM